MTLVFDLDAVREELAAEQDGLREAEASYVDGRVTDEPQWLAQIARRRQRVRDLELLRDELIGLEEAAAELGEAYRDEVIS